MSSFRNEVARVDYNITEFPSNCGINIIHNCRFYNISGNISVTTEQRESFFKAFQKHLEINTGDKNKLVMSAAIGGPRPSIYEFCKYNKWHEGQHTFNSNSGNIIVLFEFSKGNSLRERKST